MYNRHMHLITGDYSNRLWEYALPMKCVLLEIISIHRAVLVFIHYWNVGLYPTCLTAKVQSNRVQSNRVLTCFCLVTGIRFTCLGITLLLERVVFVVCLGPFPIVLSPASCLHVTLSALFLGISFFSFMLGQFY